MQLDCLRVGYCVVSVCSVDMINCFMSYFVFFDVLMLLKVSWLLVIRTSDRIVCDHICQYLLVYFV